MKLLRAAPLALPSAGKISAARIAVIALTTSNSMKVKAKKGTAGFLTEVNEDNGEHARPRVFRPAPSPLGSGAEALAER
jgi:hypothetical protein